MRRPVEGKGRTPAHATAEQPESRAVARRIAATEVAEALTDARRVLHVAAIFANITRAKILMLLLTYPKLTVGTLASLSGVSVSLVSHNLALLRTEGWVTVSVVGRTRLVRLASPERAMAVRELSKVGRLLRSAAASI